jgi:protein-L-isoaspartate(D-aspartate) O-methyltransferase
MDGNGNRAWAAADFDAARREMVERQIRSRGIRSPRVLDAMIAVPRHLFVPREHVMKAYGDTPLPIGDGQTISQPYMVAAMADALLLEGNERVLEVGAGSGYQAAVLSLLAQEVMAVEAQPALFMQTRERMARLGYTNVRIEEGDGSLGWPPCEPREIKYDAILVSAAAPAVPPPLLEQLAEGGRLLMPIGTPERQELVRVVMRRGRTTQESLFACRFVPLTGQYGWRQNVEGTTTR